ncbi:MULTISPECIES: hypothetical protein [Catenuloplanes]|uniref:Uncharacterized protein n=1 Tax=Catenuloplanes niger TaxID=587534 RepID=A0AAE4CUR6_9ACTN|nr:hypothetical protein [Catenuloplanes niger]MDR7325405.1 hypothetical protein [Catenuloplanes niger]
MTSAAATVFPIRHGSRLTLRRARNVISGRAFGAFTDRAQAVVGLVELLLNQQQSAVLRSFERDRDRVGQAFVPEVAETPHRRSLSVSHRYAEWLNFM